MTEHDQAAPTQTSGTDLSDSPTSADPESPRFADLGLDPRVLQAVTDVGYETPSEIQAATIPLLMAERDVLGLAQTGTGKTAAFGLPLLSLVDPSVRATQALVLAPTRELALQVAEAIGRYAARLEGLSVLPIYGGGSYAVQLSGLRRGAQVVIGTPGRLIDHLSKGTLDLSSLRMIVLDEADEMLRMGFAEDVETILAKTPDDAVKALFSATMPPQIRRISRRYLSDPAEVTVATRTVTTANTRQRFLLVSNQGKLDALTRVLEVEQHDAVIVFVRTKQATEDLAERLRARGFSAAAINGDLVQAQRERTISQLKSGEIDILVATDVAARGLDVERIGHVVNYDIPHDTESYVHRIGRTGRAGRSGEALLFVTPRERRMLDQIERATRQPLEEMPVPSVDDVNAQRVSRFHDGITAGLGSEQLAFFRGLLTEYAETQNVDPLDIAAALAAQSYEQNAFLLPPEPVGERKPARAPRGPGHARDEHGPQQQRAGQASGGRRPRRPGAPLVGYRIEVGRRHKVMPGAIVGAIANEGGLRREDFGHIDIRADHSVVELPADLPHSAINALSGTRISGRLINLQRLPDAGRAPRREPSGAKRRRPS